MKNIYRILSFITLTTLVVLPLRAQYTISVQEFIHASGNCNAIVYITVEGNGGPFDVGLYHLDFPEVAYVTFEGVESGTTIQYEIANVVNIFTVRIEDAYGCEHVEDVQYDCDCGTLNVDFAESQITQPLTCADGDYSGSYSKLSQHVYNGSPPYSYDWGDPNVVDNDWSFDGFAHGIYEVTVTDENDCTATDRIEFIAQNAPGYSSTITKPCEGIANGEIYFLSGGTSMMWSTGDFTTNVDITLTDLGPGDYCVTITDDATQCEIEHCIELLELPSCGNFEVILDQVVTSKSCKDQPTGSATIPAIGGNPFSGSGLEVDCDSDSYDYVWSGLANNGSVLDPTISFKTITGIFAGMYTVTITDRCERQITHQVVVNEHPVIEATLTAVIGCPGEGMLSVTPSLGAGGPYMYHWPHDPTETSNSLTDLDQGFYTVEITDVAGCIESFTEFVPNHPEMQLSITETSSVCFIPDLQDDNGFQPISVETFKDGVLNLNVTWLGGTGSTNLNATYQWNDFVNSTTQDLNTITHEDFDFQQSSKTFFVTVVDENGCSKTATFTMHNEIVMDKFPNEQEECGIDFRCDGTLVRSVPLSDFIECDVYSEVDCGVFECFCDYENDFQNIALASSNKFLFPLNLPDFEGEEDPTIFFGENCEDTRDCPLFDDFDFPNKPIGYQSPFAGPTVFYRNPCPFDAIVLNPNPYALSSTDPVIATVDIPAEGGIVSVSCPSLPNIDFSTFKDEGSQEVSISASDITVGGLHDIIFEFGMESKTLLLEVIACDHDNPCPDGEYCDDGLCLTCPTFATDVEYGNNSDCKFEYFLTNSVDESLFPVFIEILEDEVNLPVNPSSNNNVNQWELAIDGDINTAFNLATNISVPDDNTGRLYTSKVIFEDDCISTFTLGTFGCDDGTESGLVSDDSVVTRNNESVDLKNDKDRLNVFPNPSSSTIYIDFSSNDKISLIRLLDIHNQEIRVFSRSEANELDVSYLSSGVYIIEVETISKNSYNQKFIKI